MAILNSYLKPIADAIRSKKGTTEPINAQHFAEEINSIQIGAKINAFGLTGTPVPASGTFPTFYLNLKLTNEKVDEILGSVLDSMSENTSYYIIRNNKTSTSGYFIKDLYIKRVGTTYSIVVFYWRPNTTYTRNIYTSTDGFITGNMNYLFNENGMYLDTANVDITQSGTVSETQFKYNDKLKSLFSLTEFTDSEELDRTIELSGEFTGKNIKITENQIIDVESILMENEFPLKIDVEVESSEVIPDGYLLPQGTLDITSNGEKEVSQYAKVNVSVPNVIPEGYVLPSGSLSITENGEHNVSNYEKVNVNVQAQASSGDMLQLTIDATKSCRFLFYNYTGTNVDFISGLDTSNVNDMNSMFKNCNNLLYIPQLNTSNNITMNEMFHTNKKLESIKLNTDKVTNIYNAFYLCENIKIIDFSYYNINNTSNSYYAFYYCKSLKALIIREIGTNYLLNSNAFDQASHFNGEQHYKYNPDGLKDGYIYVPRAMVDTLKSATNWSKHATQIRPLEDYTLDGTTTGELNLTAMGLGG